MAYCNLFYNEAAEIICFWLWTKMLLSCRSSGAFFALQLQLHLISYHEESVHNYLIPLVNLLYLIRPQLSKLKEGCIFIFYLLSYQLQSTWIATINMSKNLNTNLLWITFIQSYYSLTFLTTETPHHPSFYKGYSTGYWPIHYNNCQPVYIHDIAHAHN